MPEATDLVNCVFFVLFLVGPSAVFLCSLSFGLGLSVALLLRPSSRVLRFLAFRFRSALVFAVCALVLAVCALARASARPRLLLLARPAACSLLLARCLALRARRRCQDLLRHPRPACVSSLAVPGPPAGRFVVASASRLPVKSVATTYCAGVYAFASLSCAAWVAPSPRSIAYARTTRFPINLAVPVLGCT